MCQAFQSASSGSNALEEGTDVPGTSRKPLITSLIVTMPASRSSATTQRRRWSTLAAPCQRRISVAARILPESSGGSGRDVRRRQGRNTWPPRRPCLPSRAGPLGSQPRGVVVATGMAPSGFARNGTSALTGNARSMSFGRREHIKAGPNSRRTATGAHGLPTLLWQLPQPNAGEETARVKQSEGAGHPISDHDQSKWSR